jgi:hypothetical protein
LEGISRSAGANLENENPKIRLLGLSFRWPFFVALAPHMYNFANQFFGSQSFQNSQNQDLRFTFRVRNPRLDLKVTQLPRIVVTV